jgi:4-hydroxythreonine-4-phosphate dehydrogenase
MAGPQRILATQGDPEGIGPEVLLRALHAGSAGDADVTVLGDQGLLLRTADALDVPPPERILPAPEPGRAATLWALEEACLRALRGEADAIVTAPIHKADLAAIGFTFPGQTEFLGDRLGGVETTMMLAGPCLRVALVTTHLRLADVPAAVTRSSVEAAIRRTADGLGRWYGVQAPRLGVLGLNPHAGEDGLFGDEDRERIAPAVAACRADGIDCVGPLPGDGTFAPRSRRGYDAIVAMYHDQGLSALKAVEGGGAVNVTLGLPVLRTSPDHGTARDIAGQGLADPASMAAALRLAAGIVQNPPPKR